MAVKDCSAMGTILRRGIGVSQKVQFITFVHILTSEDHNLTFRWWKFDPKVKIWSWWEIDFDLRGRKSILWPEIDPPPEGQI